MALEKIFEIEASRSNVGAVKLKIQKSVNDYSPDPRVACLWLMIGGFVEKTITSKHQAIIDELNDPNVYIPHISLLKNMQSDSRLNAMAKDAAKALGNSTMEWTALGRELGLYDSKTSYNILDLVTP